MRNIQIMFMNSAGVGTKKRPIATQLYGPFYWITVTSLTVRLAALPFVQGAAGASGAGAGASGAGASVAGASAGGAISSFL